MAEFGYDLAGESVALFGRYEMRTYEAINLKNLKVAELVGEMEDLELFLRIVEKKSESFKKDGDHKVDFDLDQEHVTLIQRLAENPELRHIFDPTKFSFLNGEITAIVRELQGKFFEWGTNDNLKRIVAQRIEGPLQRNINRGTEEIMLDHDELNKALDLFNRGLQRMTRLNETILQNITRAH